MNIYVVLKFDPMQCGACGNGSVNKLFLTHEEAQPYIQNVRGRRGVSWDTRKHKVELYEQQELEVS